MSIIDFSLLYTSRRPDKVGPVIQSWMSQAANIAGVEMVMTADHDDPRTAGAMTAWRKNLRPMGCNIVGPIPSPGNNCVAGWNTAANACKGKVLIAISDDFVPPARWDEKLRGPWCDKDTALMVNDGQTPERMLMMTLPIVTRLRFERIGYLLHPAYQSMFVDNDLAEHAKLDGSLDWLADKSVIFKHGHYVNNQRAKDDVDARHSSRERMESGRRIFEARRSLGFPVDTGPKAVMPDVPNEWIAYIQTTGDDFCLKETCQRLLDERLQAFLFAIPSHTWRLDPVHPSKMEEVEAIAYDLAAKGARVFIQRPNVMGYRGLNARLAIDIETRVRNAALEQCQQLGFGHVLIVDSDELWKPGLLPELQRLVKFSNPAYVSCRSVPVVGVKGLPVEGATDKVGIYIRADNRFIFCRGPYRNGGHELAGFPLYHFTAVRRTESALADKMRNSGHYDDPDYAFEHWLRDVLPSLAPGSRNVHMYRKGKNIWPELRNWTNEELKEIPGSLYQYLCLPEPT